MATTKKENKGYGIEGRDDDFGVWLANREKERMKKQTGKSTTATARKSAAKKK